ncbi:restriction endonuclease subunit S [Empedobacter brevis]
MRFPGFEEEWETKKLGEVSSVSSGGTPSRANPLYWNGDIPWISTTLIDFNFIEKSEEYITQEGLENSSAKLFPIGTLLMAMYGQGKTRGKVAILNIEATTNQACGAITTNKEVLNPFFAFQNLVKRYDEIRDLSNQGSQENLSGGIIKGIEITFPKLPEQIKITSFLSLIDERIQTQNKMIEQLETLIKGLSEKIFSRKIRFVEFTGDWKVKRLGEIFYSEKGKGLSKDKLTVNGKYECLLYGELYTKYKEVIFNVVSKTNEEDGLKSQIGDLLIPSSTTTTGIDLANVTAINKENVLLGGDITVLRSKEKINNIFYAYYLSNYKKEEIANYTQGSTIVHLYYNHMKNMEIDFPSLEEQTKIARFLSSIDAKIETEKNILDKYHSQKQYLLQNLFI